MSTTSSTHPPLARPAPREVPFSAHTLKAINSDFKQFSLWCEQEHTQPFPITPEKVRGFLNAMAPGRAVSTLRRYLSSLTHLCRERGEENPCANPLVKKALSHLIRHAQAESDNSVRPIDRHMLERMLKGAGSSLLDLRDAAMLSTAYDSLLLRSELAALRVEEIHFQPDGFALLGGASIVNPCDPQAPSRHIAPDTVHRLRRWIDAAKISEGPLFRSVRSGRVGSTALSDRNITRAFQRLAERAGFDSKGISSLSCRFGAARDMLAAGLKVEEVMLAGGWSSPVMLLRHMPAMLHNPAATPVARLAARQGRLS